MGLIGKLFTALIANAAGLLATAYFVPGFVIVGGSESFNYRAFIVLALVLTALNFLVKPFLKLLLGPIIILTLGLGLIAVNAFLLYILDVFSKDLMIETIPALLLATLIIGFANLVFHSFTKK